MRTVKNLSYKIKTLAYVRTCLLYKKLENILLLSLPQNTYPNNILEWPSSEHCFDMRTKLRLSPGFSFLLSLQSYFPVCFHIYGLETILLILPTSEPGCNDQRRPKIKRTMARIEGIATIAFFVCFFKGSI